MALDLDGTAIMADGNVSARLKRAVDECLRRKISVILATGRMPQSAERYWQELSLPPGLLVAYQGAMVVQLPEGRVQAKITLTDDSARRAVQWALKENLLTQVYVGTELWVSREDPRVRDYIETHHITAWVRGPEQITDWPEPPIKVLLQDDPQVLDRLRGDLVALMQNDPVRVFKSQSDYLEVVHLTAGKSEGLKLAARALGITQERVFAVGDAENDIDMLRWAGFGVAMGQAPDSVKRAADAVTASVQQDGAAKAVEQWVLEMPVEHH